MSANDAWIELFNKYDIVNKVEKEGFFEISSEAIKEFKEARLMAKWDSSESLPSVFKEYNINILPITRRAYVLSDFKLYQEIPELIEDPPEMQQVNVPEFESIDIKNITSESNAINVLVLSNILDDFLEEEDNVATFNGRMGTGEFSFNVDRIRETPLNINVNKAQCEIDGGFENNNSVVIIEAKNVVHPDFHVRQLYYPYRLWKTKIKKPIRLVLSIYSNQIYRLFEYEFNDINNYSSISLIKQKNYSLQDVDITHQDLGDVFESTEVKYTNCDSLGGTPFIQADSFERVISLLEALSYENKTPEEIADIMQFEERQSDYYFNAGKYLGLFEKIDIMDNGIKKRVVTLTDKGREVYNLNYKERQLELVKLILQHKIFNVLFKIAYDTGSIPREEFSN